MRAISASEASARSATTLPSIGEIVRCTAFIAPRVIAWLRVTDTAFPFRFRCQRSGNCCARPEGAVRVSDADVARIAAHLGLGVAAVRSRYVAATGDRLVDGLG